MGAILLKTWLLIIVTFVKSYGPRMPQFNHGIDHLTSIAFKNYGHCSFALQHSKALTCHYYFGVNVCHCWFCLMIFLLLLAWALIFKQQANSKLFCNLLESLTSKLQWISVDAKKLQGLATIAFKLVASCNSFNFKSWKYFKDLVPHCI